MEHLETVVRARALAPSPCATDNSIVTAGVKRARFGPRRLQFMSSGVLRSPPSRTGPRSRGAQGSGGRVAITLSPPRSGSGKLVSPPRPLPAKPVAPIPSQEGGDGGDGGDGGSVVAAAAHNVDDYLSAEVLSVSIQGREKHAENGAERPCDMGGDSGADADAAGADGDCDGAHDGNGDGDGPSNSGGLLVAHSGEPAAATAATGTADTPVLGMAADGTPQAASGPEQHASRGTAAVFYGTTPVAAPRLPRHPPLMASDMFTAHDDEEEDDDDDDGDDSQCDADTAPASDSAEQERMQLSPRSPLDTAGDDGNDGDDDGGHSDADAAPTSDIGEQEGTQPSPQSPPDTPGDENDVASPDGVEQTGLSPEVCRQQRHAPLSASGDRTSAADAPLSASPPSPEYPSVAGLPASRDAPTAGADDCGAACAGLGSADSDGTDLAGVAVRLAAAAVAKAALATPVAPDPLGASQSIVRSVTDVGIGRGPQDMGMELDMSRALGKPQHGKAGKAACRAATATPNSDFEAADASSCDALSDGARNGSGIEHGADSDNPAVDGHTNDASQEQAKHSGGERTSVQPAAALASVVPQQRVQRTKPMHPLSAQAVCIDVSSDSDADTDTETDTDSGSSNHSGGVVNGHVAVDSARGFGSPGSGGDDVVFVASPPTSSPQTVCSSASPTDPPRRTTVSPLAVAGGTRTSRPVPLRPAPALLPSPERRRPTVAAVSDNGSVEDDTDSTTTSDSDGADDVNGVVKGAAAATAATCGVIGTRPRIGVRMSTASNPRGARVPRFLSCMDELLESDGGASKSSDEAVTMQRRPLKRRRRTCSSTDSPPSRGTVTRVPSSKPPAATGGPRIEATPTPMPHAAPAQPAQSLSPTSGGAKLGSFWWVRVEGRPWWPVQVVSTASLRKQGVYVDCVPVHKLQVLQPSAQAARLSLLSLVGSGRGVSQPRALFASSSSSSSSSPKPRDASPTTWRGGAAAGRGNATYLVAPFNLRELWELRYTAGSDMKPFLAGVEARCVL